jgi:phosphatidylserine/phosphatidylglycerophosphate/cardiolipin synthase-like enzyme
MIEPLHGLSERDLHDVALALRSGRLSPPFSCVTLQRIVSNDCAQRIAEAFQRLAAAGFSAEQVAIAMELLRADRLHRPRIEDVLELVTTGPDVAGVANRDTGVVVRELFANARQSVLVTGYAVYQGQRVFQALADRMLEVPDLQVRLFLDIQRGRGDTTAPAELVRRFAERFRTSQWPKERPLPEVYFDRRSVDLDRDQRACLHAKVVVVDGRHVFVSSANFTEAAQLRNIEVGVVTRSELIARQLTEFVDAQLRAGTFARVPIIK